MNRSHVTERILKLTLEIIYLLTGEDFIPERKFCDDVKDYSHSHVPGKLSQANELPHSPLIDESKNEKILELTNKIIELLTGEVPIRCEDITVCFTMEEWDYVEGHKELYMNIIKENHKSLVLAGTVERPDFYVNRTADKSQLRITDDCGGGGGCEEKNNGKCDGQYQTIIPNKQNTSKPVENMALDLTSHTEGSTTDHVAETSPEQLVNECNHKEGGSDDKNHVKESETYASFQPPVSQYCSPIKEESNPSEDRHYEVSCFFTPAEQEDCEYLYITEDGNTHVSGSKLTVMTCSDCGDRFTVESDDACFERLQPYRCRRCSKCHSESDVREVPTVAISELPRTSNFVGDHEKGNVDRKKSFAGRKHLDDKKIIRRKKACSYSKWVGYSEDNGSFDSYNILPEDKVFICSHCGKGFNHQASLELHQKTHMVEKASFISQNGKYLRNKALPKSHQLIHAYGNQYNCSECGKSFKRSLSLVEHMQLHTGEKTFTCPDCGQSFTQRSAYITHHKIHIGGKFHFCYECGKSFRTKADLTTHQRIHLGETPFPCPVCGESFTRRANLVRHQRVHTGEKPFPCPDCEKCFTRKLGLMKHQKIHSGENVYKRGYRKNAFSMYRVIV